MSRQKTPFDSPVPSALEQASFAAESLGVRGCAQGAAIRLCLFNVRKTPIDEPVTVTFKCFFNAPYVDKVASNAYDHAFSAPSADLFARLAAISCILILARAANLDLRRAWKARTPQ